MTLKIKENWIDFLDDEDLMFIKRLVLASGSLKKVAREYDISYPTVRLRLDRLIAKIQVIEDQRVVEPFERLLRSKYAEGKLSADTLKQVLAAHREAGGGEK